MSQIKINLLFDANTTAAQNNIKQLSTSLHQITTGTKIGIDNGPLQTAVQSAQQLQVHLQNAMNVDTGKLDLHKLNTSLKQSNTSLTTLAKNLLATGQQGQQAFVQLANSIAMAQTPALNFGSTISGLMTTLGNTVKWSIASKGIQAVSSGISGAIKHAQDLNTALNDIRIVTGYSKDRMAAFADDARKAAQALNTTSTEYAKASLIFYQQGLSGSEVTERADTVIKLANVIGQSTDTVSDWMTAIWNNFDNGSKSLEYYADVLVNLGASTASSAEEITAGLEKFAAIADTVGLSYETAAASLATVTAETRQSADVVGTAFKTIFARMEGLKLGETLDDGTTLNQYSEAMAKVGINIMDSNNQLKDMDSILAEMGEKWKILNKDQQVALAQSVGGIRQYNQLIALMDNWDTVQLNVELAEDSENTLQEQADIWGDSWEAASKRVKESQNILYEQFINDESITGLTNLFADLISGINEAIDAMHGIGPMALMLAGIFSKSLFPMLMNGFNTLTSNLSVMFGVAQKEVVATQNSMMRISTAVSQMDNVSLGMKKQLETSNLLTKARQDLELATHGLSKAQREAAEAQMKIYEADVQSLQVGYEKIAQMEKEAKAKASLALTDPRMTQEKRTELVTANITQQYEKENASKTFMGGTMGAKDITHEATTTSIQTGYQNKETSFKALSSFKDTTGITSLESDQQNLQKQLDDPTAERTQEETDKIQQELDKINKELEEKRKLHEDNLKKLESEYEYYREIYNMQKQIATDSKSDEALYKTKVSDKALQPGLGMIATESGARGLEDEESHGVARKQQAESVERLQKAGIDASIETSPGGDTALTSVTASQESLAMVSQMTGEYKAQAEQLDTVLQDLTISGKALDDSFDQMSAAMGKDNKETTKSKKLKKDLEKQLSSTRKGLETLKNSLKLTDKQTEKFDKALKKLKTSSGKGGVQGAMKDITSVLNEVRNGTKLTEAEMADLGDKILGELVQAGMGEQELKDLMNTMKQLGIDTTNLEEKFKSLENNMPKPKVSGFQMISQGLASAAGSAAMAISAFTMLSDVFKEGIKGPQDWMTLLMSLSMLLPIVTTAVGALSTAKLGNAAATMLEALGEEIYANKIKETMANEKASWAVKMKTILLNVAEGVTKALGLGFPQGLIAAGIVAAAAAAIVGGILIAANAGNVSDDEAEKKNEDSQKQVEETKKVLEAADAWKEKNEALDAAAQEYDELSKKTNRTIEEEERLKELQEDITKQMPELIEKYKELGEALGEDWSSDIAAIEEHLATGNTEAAIKAEEELEDKANAATAKSAAEGMTAQAYSVAYKMRDKQGDITKDGKYEVHVGGKGSYVEGLLKNSKVSGFGDANNISLDTTDGNKFIEQYQELQKIAKEAEEAGKTGDDAYREIKELLDASAEEYANLEQLRKDGLSYTLEAFMDEKNIIAENITSYDDYVKQKDKFVKAAVDAKKATKEEAEAFFEAQNALSDFARIEQKVQVASEKFGTSVGKKVEDFLKSVPKEDLEYALKIDLTYYQDPKSWEMLTNYYKQLEVVEEKTKNTQSAIGALDKLNEDMSSSDWTDLQKSLTWGQNGLITYSEFLSKSYEEQQAYLRGFVQHNSQQTIAASEKLVAELEAGLAKLDPDSKDYTNALAELEQARIKLQLARKQAEETRKKLKEERQAWEDNIEDLKEEVDNYYTLNRLGKELERVQNKIADAKDRAWGVSKLKYIELENKALQANIDANNKRIALLQSENKTNKSVLSQYGTQFDENGEISNYEQINNKFVNDLAKLKPDSEAYEDKNREWEKWKKYADNYTNNLDEIKDKTEQNAEDTRAMLDNTLEGIEYEVEVKIEISDEKIAILERLLTKLDDDAYDGAERIVNYQQQADQYISQQNTAKKGITDTLSASGVSEKDIQAYMDGDGAALSKYEISDDVMTKLQGYTEDFTKAQDGLNGIDEKVKGELMTTFNAWHDKIEDVGTSLQNYQSIMENYKNIVDTIGMDKLGLNEQDIRNMEEATQKTLDAQVANAKAQMDTTKAALEDVQKKKAGAKVGSEEYEYWEAREKELSRQLEEDTANATSLWASAIENAYTTFEEQTKRAIEAFEDSLAGANFGSLDELQASIDKQNQASERYLSNYEKAYELSKLNRNIQKEMDNIDDPKKKQALAELQEEIAAKTAEGVEMSENDLRYLQQKYDLKVAEIALENAQNAKSQVRLQKDSQGNFNYVYTVDENKTADAEQKYEDAMYEMEKSNEEYLNKLQEQIISNRKAMIAELSELNIQDYANVEEYEAAKAKIVEFYTAQEAYYMQEMQKQFDYNKEHYDQDVVFYSDYNQQKAGIYGADQVAYAAYVVDKKDKDKQIVDSFGETVLGMETGFSNIQGYHSAFLTAIGTAGKNGKGGSGLLGDMGTAYDSLDSTVNGLAETFNIKLGADGSAQKDMTSFKNHINTTMYGEGGSKSKPTGGVVGATNAAESATKEYEKTAKSKFSAVSNSVNTWYSTYGPKVQQGEQDTIDLNTAINNLKSVKITVDTSVNGEQAVNNLEQAIKDLQDAINGLSDKTFTITANVSTNSSYTTSGSSGSSSYGSGTPRNKINPTGNRNYVEYNGKWYSKGKSSDAEWADFQNGISGPTSSMTTISNNAAQGMQNMWNTLRSDSGIELTTTTPYFTGYSQASGGLTGSVTKGSIGWLEAHPNVSVEDLVYQQKKVDNSDYWYWAKVKVNGDANSAFKKGSTYWVPVAYLNRGGTTAYYDSSKLLAGSYDTGGYTGEWGSDGRMAILHQKEIVLNAHDTENFLTAIGIVRDISNRLDQQASIMSMGLSSVFANVMTPKEKSDTLQQEVHITAEFPNATNHSEIEEAFRNLPNLASQYIYRK